MLFSWSRSIVDVYFVCCKISQMAVDEAVVCIRNFHIHLLRRANFDKEFYLQEYICGRERDWGGGGKERAREGSRASMAEQCN